MTTEPDRRDGKSVLTLVLEQNEGAPALARAAISAFFEKRHVPEAAVATVNLLVSELVTNAVTHPQVEQPADVRLVARVEPQIIRVEVTDDGGGFDPRSVDSGYGLSLLEKETLRWGVDDLRGNRVWFEVALDDQD